MSDVPRIPIGSIEPAHLDASLFPFDWFKVNRTTGQIEPQGTHKFSNIPTYSEIASGVDDATSGLTTTPAVPTILECRAVGIGGILLKFDTQPLLSNPGGYRIQANYDNGATWYKPALDGTGLGAASEYLEWPNEFFVHPAIPFGGSASDPTGRTVYYRVARVNTDGDASDWSTVVNATNSPVYDGSIAEDVIYANNIKASEIATMLLRATTAYLGYKSKSGTTTIDAPGEGDIVIKIESYVIYWMEYTGGAWVSANSLQVGIFISSLFLPVIGCQGIYHPGNPPTATELLPNPNFRVFNFENNYQDQNGLDDWGAKSNCAFSSTVKKFGSYSLTGTANNQGSITGATAAGVIGSNQALFAQINTKWTGGEAAATYAVDGFSLADGAVNNLIRILISKVANSNDVKVKIDVKKNGSTVLDYTDTVVLTQEVFHLIGFCYQSATDKIYLVIDDRIIDCGVLGGSWGAGTFTLGATFGQNYNTGGYGTVTTYFDEYVLGYNRYCDPNLLAQHYTHNVAWDTSVSAADILIRPGTDGRVLIPETYPIYQKTLSAVLALDSYKTIAHGLGVIPGIVEVSLICLTAELGFSIGDEAVPYSISASGINYLWTWNADATNIYISTKSCASYLYVPRKDTGVAATVTIANWQWKIRCHA